MINHRKDMFFHYRDDKFMDVVTGSKIPAETNDPKHIIFDYGTDIQKGDCLKTALETENLNIVAIETISDVSCHLYIKAYFLFDYEMNTVPSIVAVNNSDISIQKTYHSNTQVNNQTHHNESIVNNHTQNFINEITCTINDNPEKLQEIISAINTLKTAIDNKTPPPESTWNKLGAASSILAAVLAYLQIFGGQIF